jgi:AcrR family transcriptional regulator
MFNSVSTAHHQKVIEGLFMANPPDRHSQRKAVTRQKLLDAAQEVIVNKGYTQVEILDITEQANVSRGTFYQHFRNKQECVRALMQQGFDALSEEISGSKVAFPSRPEWAMRSFSRVFNWADENRALLTVMVGGTVSPELNAFGRDYMTQVIERHILEDPVLLEQSQPRLYPADVLAQIITGMVIQVLGWWLNNETDHTPEQMGTMLRDIVFYGVTPRMEE